MARAAQSLFKLAANEYGSPSLLVDGVDRWQRLMLEVCGLFLSHHQGVMPNYGIIWHGRETKATKAHLNSDRRNVEQLLKGLQVMLNSEAPPKLILNEHCQICEFRQRCHDQAIQQDNLSLLRGLSEKEIKKCGKKGIFTITQLAHTFRPRRKGKREAQTTYHHHYALQALAIRDKKIYTLGKPELPSSPVHVYLDIEGDPEADFIYLIGMVIVENGLEKSHSFWADHKGQEAKIFEQFVSEVTRYDDFLVFCYGGYELGFLKRMRKVAKKKKLADKVLNASVNILSLIYSHIYFPTYSNGLKDIGGYLGLSWTEPGASGIQSIVWRKKWDAEHAIKQFAYYRENTNGMLTETGMSDYLVLLSICQTCHYKGGGFLKFLLSRERDVDAFWERPHRKRHSPIIEVYPKGFIPSHLAYRQKQKSHSNQLKGGASPLVLPKH